MLRECKSARLARFLNAAYDLMLEHDGRVLREQTKCTKYKKEAWRLLL